jgi:hypothetical protein
MVQVYITQRLPRPGSARRAKSRRVSDRGWLPHIAFGGWLLALVLFAPNFAYLVAEVFPPNDPQRSEQECRSDYKKANSKPDAESPSLQSQAADTEKNAHDYCVQRRTAKAAERQADYALWGFFVSGAALFGLFGTLIFTGISAEEARRTADAAHDANRPWIEIVITEKRSFSLKPSLARIELMASLKNRGNAPATSVMSRAILVPVPESHSETGTAVAVLEALLDGLDQRQADQGSTIFPGVELEPRPYGWNVRRQDLDEAAGDPGNKVKFWVAIGVRYKFGDRWCRTLYGYLLKIPGRAQSFATSETIELTGEGFTLAGMAQEYAS